MTQADDKARADARIRAAGGDPTLGGALTPAPGAPYPASGDPHRSPTPGAPPIMGDPLRGGYPGDPRSGYPKVTGRSDLDASRRGEGLVPDVFTSELASLRALEKSLSEAFVAYQGTKADRADGHVIHAVHNNLGEYAGRELGRAHGGVVQALAALEAFASKEDAAAEAHALEERKKEFIFDYLNGRDSTNRGDRSDPDYRGDLTGSQTYRGDLPRSDPAYRGDRADLPGGVPGGPAYRGEGFYRGERTVAQAEAAWLVSENYRLAGETKAAQEANRQRLADEDSEKPADRAARGEIK